jgi:transcription-repair coupling factor (superfamily II helicase)
LLDIWPQSEPSPVRLDFFGDEIDTIRRFDPGSQRTVDKLAAVLVTPAREYLMVGKPDKADTLGGSGLSDISDRLSEFHIPFAASILRKFIGLFTPGIIGNGG